MIRNDSITYEATESHLLTWRAEDPILHSFLVAFFTTILAYQLTAILFDLLVGFKPMGKASVTDLTSVILAQESSLLSAAANMFQNVRLWQWRFRTQGLDVPKLESKKAVITFPVRFKFCILFCVAPVLQLLAIIVSLERDSVLTFDEVKFGGIALGFNQNQSLDFSQESGECTRYRIGHTAHEVTTASFHLCSHAFDASGSILNITMLSVSKTPREEILVRLEGPVRRYELLVRADVRIFGQIYRLRAEIFQKEGRKLIGLGYPILAEACQNRPMPQSAVVTSSGTMWNISQAVPCTPDENVVVNAFHTVSRSITVVDADDFELIPVNTLISRNEPSSNPTGFPPVIIQGGNLAFLKRRRSLLSFSVLCIVAASALMLRILLKFLINNDTDVGIESIVKAAVRVDCCDWWLQNRSLVDTR